ncbi:hypothetical protein [Actinomadura sp. NTSP31]|uniref:DUF7144 family membrane protein n=1 Tax=Actinomadura sp. NTSP31 TaxID=1735447 RepID=UPI0035C003E5
MAEGAHPRGRGTGEPVSEWAVGLTLFAGCVMMLVGLFGAIAGLSAILKDQFYVVHADYVFKFDVTAWGWIHLAVGIVVGVAGFFVLAGRTWARALGIFLAVLNAIANFMFIPYYPVWSLLIIALDVATIWALAVYSKRSADTASD